MDIFMNLFGLLGIPLGWLLWAIYKLFGNYFISIFLFTLVVRAATFVFSLKSQKAQADRAKLAPRLERIQKKYKGDAKKIQEKQMALYEKHGISPTGGCLPMIIPMIVLFGVIAVIYAPLQHLARIPDEVITASITSVTRTGEETAETHPEKVDSRQMTGYYKELRMLLVLDKGDNRARVEDAITKVLSADSEYTASQYIDQMLEMKSKFKFFGNTMLDQPWVNGKGFGAINVLWIIPLISGLTAFASSYISMRFMKATQVQGGQPGQGCSNVMMLVAMPLFSLGITFTVPGAVGVYWVCSNMIAALQSVILNNIYSPAKIRAQAYEEDALRRQQRIEDKKRLAESRKREEEEQRLAEAEEKMRISEKVRQENTPKQAASSKNPNKQKRRAESVQAPDGNDVSDIADGQSADGQDSYDDNATPS